MRVCNTWHENKKECKKARTPASSNNLLNFNSRHLTRKIDQKGGKEKKTIKRNKYFREIKGSIKTVSVIFLFYFSFFHRAKERNNSIATI